MAQALERADVLPEARFFGAHILGHLLAAQLRIAHDHLGFALRALLHLLREPVRGDERVLQRSLVLGDVARALLERRELLLEERVLLHHRFVVLGHVFEERFDLLAVETAEAGGELLLSDVEGADPHRNLRRLPQAERQVA